MTKKLDRGIGLLEMDALYPPAAGDRSRTGFHKVVKRGRIEFNPFRPRNRYPQAELEKLGESIYQHGLIEPLVVRETPNKPGWYQIIDGERRYRSTEPRTGFRGLADLDVMVREATDEEMSDVAFIANIQRIQHTPAEEVMKVKGLMDRGLNGAQIELLMNQRADWVQKRMMLARKLAADVVWMLDYYESITYAEETNKLTGKLRKDVCAFVRSRVRESDGTIDLSVREFRKFIEDRGGNPKAIRTKPAPTGGGGSLPLPVPEKPSVGYRFKEDGPRKPSKPSPPPDVHPTAAPATAERVRGDALLLEGYVQRFDAGTWDDEQLDSMSAAIDVALRALEAAQEAIEGHR